MYKILSVGKHYETHNVTAHRHDFWELVYCTSGDGRFVFRNGTETAYIKGDTICIPPGLEHSNSSEGGFQNIHLIMDNLALPAGVFSKVTDNSSRLLYSAFAQSYYFFNCNLHYKYDILSNLGELIAGCITSFLDNAPPYSPLVENIRMEIIKNFPDTRFDLTDFLEAKNNNPEYLRKLFKSETGKTPLQFLTELRLSYAKKLLKSKQNYLNLNINETARECGFDDALYFSRIFKKHIGCSPTDYSKSGS